MKEEQRQEIERQEFVEALRKGRELYQQRFSLTEDELREKKILDVGAGERIFAASCALDNVNENVYSLEPEAELHSEAIGKLPADVRKKVEQNTFMASAEQTWLEDNSVDISLVGAVPVESEEQLLNRFRELMRVSNEVRVHPCYFSSETDHKMYKSVLDQLRKEIEIETKVVEKHASDFTKFGFSPDVPFGELLIIRKKDKTKNTT